MRQTSQATNAALAPHAAMFAAFATEPAARTFGIPHEGFTPTGAVEAFAETPVSTDGAWCWSCRRVPYRHIVSLARSVRMV